MLNEIMLRLAAVVLIVAVGFGVLVYVFKKLFPQQPKDEYLGGKPKQQSNKLWMD